MSILREIREYRRFKKKTPASDKEIVFYAEHEGYFPYFEGIINELINKHGKTVSYITSDINDPILEYQNQGLRTFYINKLLSLFMAFINCRVFFMTLTDLNQFHLKRSMNPVKYIYVFHALSSTMGYRDGAFNYYDVIFCVGPHQRKEIRKNEEIDNLSPKMLIKAGYYRLERIYKAYQEYCCQNSISPAKDTILIAPTWGADILRSYGSHLVKILLEAGYRVILRPHPETVRRLPALMDSLVSEFGENTDFILEKSVLSDKSLLQAKVLITDCYSGIGLEYALGTERPVLFLDIPIDFRKRLFNPRYQELGVEPFEFSIRSEIGVTISPDELDAIPEVISRLVSNQEMYKKRIVKIRKQNIYAFGQSSEIGAQYIMELLKGETEQ